MEPCSHQIIAALIRDARGGVLLFQRNTPPPGFAGPAGHCELGECFEEALKKEVGEEVGLQVVTYRLLTEFFDPHPCRRTSDQPGHRWRFYEVAILGEISTNDREVVPGSARYFAPHELAEIAIRTQQGKSRADGFDYPWLRFFRQMGMVENF